MTINRSLGNFQYNYYFAQQSKPSGASGTDKNTPEVQRTPGVLDNSGLVDYDSKIKEIYDKGGLQGLLEYLNSLEEGIVTNLSSVKDEEKGTWTLSFTIRGKNYTYVETKTPSTTETEPEQNQTESDDITDILDKIAKESGLKGIKKYLKSLEKGSVTYYNTCKNSENQHPRMKYMFFTLNGKNYIYSENLDAKEELKKYYDKLEELV